jgi:DNA-binding transcriptional regulator YdaS (Cro superfamily)
MSGEELRALLAAADRSQSWLATRLGLARQTVFAWVHGNAPVPAWHEEAIRRLLVAVPEREVDDDGSV